MEKLQTRPAKRIKDNPYKGASKLPNGKWSANIFYNGKSTYLGCYLSPEEASYAYSVGVRLKNKLNGIDTHTSRENFSRVIRTYVKRVPLNGNSQDKSAQEILFDKITKEDKPKEVDPLYTIEHAMHPKKVAKRNHWMEIFDQYYTGGDIAVLDGEFLQISKKLVKRDVGQIIWVENDESVYKRMLKNIMEELPLQKRYSIINDNFGNTMGLGKETFNCRAYFLDYCGTYDKFGYDIKWLMSQEYFTKDALIFITFQNSREKNGGRDKMLKPKLIIDGIPSDTAEQISQINIDIPQNVWIMNDLLLRANTWDDTYTKQREKSQWECISNTYYKGPMMQMVFRKSK